MALWLLALVLISASAASCSAPSENRAERVGSSQSESGEQAPAAVQDEPDGVVSITPDARRPETGEVEEMKVTSGAFSEGEMIPVRYTCSGENLSPPLEWDPVSGARSYAVIADDPDAPSGTWVHWLLWNQPAEETRLAEGVGTHSESPNGARQGVTSSRKTGYGGPCPPPGPAHRYYFKVYALDSELDLGPESGKPDLLVAMKGHILNEGVLMGRFQR